MSSCCRAGKVATVYAEASNILPANGKRLTNRLEDTTPEKAWPAHDADPRQSRSKSRNVVINSLSGVGTSGTMGNSDKKRVISAGPNAASLASGSYSQSTAAGFSKPKGPVPPKVGVTKRKTPGPGAQSRVAPPNAQQGTRE